MNQIKQGESKTRMDVKKQTEYGGPDSTEVQKNLRRIFMRNL